MSFLWGPDGDGQLFWECPHLSFVHVRENPEFHSLLSMDRSAWPRCLLWHGWLPALADARLGRTLGSYTEGICREWVPSDRFLADLAASDVPDHPDVWTDGSLGLEELLGVGVGGCDVYSLRSGAGWFGRRWGHLELLPPDSNVGVERCVLFDSMLFIWWSTILMWSALLGFAYCQ